MWGGIFFVSTTLKTRLSACDDDHNLQENNFQSHVNDFNLSTHFKLIEHA